VNNSINLKISVNQSPAKPLLVYDGDCGFCRKWIARWSRLTGDQVDYEPYQKAASLFPEIPLSRFQKAVQLIEPDGRVTEGAEAVFQSLARSRFLGWLLWIYAKIPGISFVSEKIYQWVADHRTLLSSVDSCGLAPADDRPTYFLSRGVFLKVLAVAYFTAFTSLWHQVDGLIGAAGILPAHRLLEQVQLQLGFQGYWFFPTLFWFCPQDWFLHFLCGGGAVLSILLFLDWFPLLCLFLLWCFYLSLVTVGSDFLGFQWDNLLLECGFLSLFLVPIAQRTGRSVLQPIPAASLWLFQWLLFRLMFSSGMVKLSSGDPNWIHLTALQYHYETQPLPTPLAWLFHQFPDWFQIFSCGFLFFVELVVPFFIFGPRRLKPIAFGFLISLQILIALTGNYCFFNLLTLGLCLFALEDAAWPTFIRKRWVSSKEKKKARYGPSWIRAVVIAVVLLVSSTQLVSVFGGRWNWPEPVGAFCEILAPFRSLNDYGLFAVMTTARPEISVEGSQDGIAWLPYEFKWKPGDVNRAPAFVAPYQPRLDWQMWFAALGNYQDNPWFVQFLIKLLQGSPDVLGLLKTNPFPGTPPQFIRAQVYDYHFTDWKTHFQTGAWWQKSYLKDYIPAFSLKDLRPAHS
jgi:predicted DCC family thiol-disulfide oxidoreductase YuxK